MIDVAANVSQYLRDRSRIERASSFDYCFNYFQRFRTNGELQAIADPEHLETSCLHLGYYLASWGMLRGSTMLHTKSYRFFEPMVRSLSKLPSTAWAIDADCYSDDSVDELLEVRDRVVAALTLPASSSACEVTPTETLVTKVMLGVLGSVPAFDTFFKRGFREAYYGKPVKANHATLMAIGSFYQENARAIEDARVCTVNFATGRRTKLRYTAAKVIDMVFLIEGGGS